MIPARQPNRATSAPESDAVPTCAHLEKLGWSVVERRKQTALWQDLEGDLLGLVQTRSALGLPHLGDEGVVRRHCELIAEDMGAELIECAVAEHVDGSAVMLICKGRKTSGFVHTGILMVPTSDTSWVWTMTSQQRAPYPPERSLWKVRGELRRLLGVRLEPWAVM